MENVSKFEQKKKSTHLTDRRDFLIWLLGGSLLISALAVAWSIIKFIVPPKFAPSSPAEAQLVASVADVPKGAGKEVVFGNKPLWVI